MRTIPLTKGHEALVDDEDYERVSKYCWHAHVGKRTVYGRATVTLGRQYLHNFIFGACPVDHLDGNGLNCQRYNLREASGSDNAHNVSRHRDNTSGFKGVFRTRGLKWQAKIGVPGRVLYLGTFDRPVDAAEAYDFAALLLHGEFARTNLVY